MDGLEGVGPIAIQLVVMGQDRERKRESERERGRESGEKERGREREERDALQINEVFFEQT